MDPCASELLTQSSQRSPHDSSGDGDSSVHAKHAKGRQGPPSRGCVGILEVLLCL